MGCGSFLYKETTEGGRHGAQRVVMAARIGMVAVGTERSTVGSSLCQPLGHPGRPPLTCCSSC